MLLLIARCFSVFLWFSYLSAFNLNVSSYR